MFAAISAKKDYQSDKHNKYISKQQVPKKIATGSKNPFRKSKQKKFLKQQFCSKFSGISFQIQWQKITFRKEKPQIRVKRSAKLFKKSFTAKFCKKSLKHQKIGFSKFKRSIFQIFFPLFF